MPSIWKRRITRLFICSCYLEMNFYDDWRRAHKTSRKYISSPSATFDEGLRFFAGKGMVNNALTEDNPQTQ